LSHHDKAGIGRGHDDPSSPIRMNQTTSDAAEGYSCARDYQLFGPGSKRVLALDGGGVRGAISVAFLERIEALLSQQHGRPVRLGDHFNLVGGTSTGAVIAGAMALGHTTAEIKDFYLRLAPRVFTRAIWQVPGLLAKFDALDQLSIISVGTGSHRSRLPLRDLRWFGPLKVTLRALLSMMGDAQTLALAQMQWLGHCPQPWVINSEIGDLAQDGPPGGKWFHFLRYDVRLEAAWLKEHLGLSLTEREVERFRRMAEWMIPALSIRSTISPGWRRSRRCSSSISFLRLVASPAMPMSPVPPCCSERGCGRTVDHKH
jgi:Patatin-like phospholipase